MEFQQRVEGVFHRVFGDPDLKLTREMVASDVDGWDSLTHIQLIVALEKEFGIRFKASEAVSFQNVGDLMDRIQSKVQAK